MIDPRTPVIVGAGQVGHGLSGVHEPMDLLDLALDRAVADCRGAPLLERADLVALVRTGTVAYRNAAATLARRRGLDRARTMMADFGGHMGQVLVADVAAAITRGDCEVAIVGGMEMGSALRMPEPPSPVCDEPGPPWRMIGDDIGEWISNGPETTLGLTMPIQVYPLLEVARAWEKGQSLSAHMRDVARLWSRFSEAAAANPHAVDRRIRGAEELFPASESSRFVGYPYTKLMNSDQFVDQAAALVICSNAAADAAGIPRDRRVYPLVTAQATNGFVSHRSSLAGAPALARAGRAIEAHLGCPLAEAPLADLYACFPSAVEIQAEALGLPFDAALTLTGGMRFAGGPWNSYALHMIANVVDRLRETAGGWAVTSANGGLASRFCAAVYSAAPPEQAYRQLDQPFARQAEEICPIDTAPEGSACIEAFSVMHDRANRPQEAFLAARTAAGARAWARFDDRATLDALLSLEQPGASVHFHNGQAELRP
ncbi:hypothetical protein MB02_11675 [Croceicoccus estronivorus]|uniref:hypothetical protein n=1 Tax=Croceicoccus estronivorus TaxID=1172626 RepID=UPI00082F25C5|nr:hypothetical protein [Croceicoccus estronivorus]OCC23292.1 hypothetical protein MB02_11675 [Croceicoccus estronivorus]